MSLTERKCELCGGLSSTVRCYSCTSSPAGVALILAEIRVAELERRVRASSKSVDSRAE